MTTDHVLFGWLSLALTVISYLPYIVSVWRGNTRPHVFGWAIWALVSLIAAAGQYAGAAGPGYWATLLSGLFCIVITIMAALQKGDKSITRHDKILFVSALLAMPLWYVTNDPLSAILLVTLIDASGYIPTMRKSWYAPHHEMPLHYIISNVKHILAIAATVTLSVTTLLYPITLFVLNTALILMIYYRRRQLAYL